MSDLYSKSHHQGSIISSKSHNTRHAGVTGGRQPIIVSPRSLRIGPDSTGIALKRLFHRHSLSIRSHRYGYLTSDSKVDVINAATPRMKSAKQPADKINKRNYYRVLFVQPDAPMEIIQASYRTIMQKLKAHPDLGGDTWNASVINEAYEVLTDHQKRVHYDAELFQANQMRDLSLQSKAQRYQKTQKESEPVDFTATWQEFRPHSV